MSSISSFVLRLAVEEPVVFQSFSGFAACGVFYELLKSVDKDLAERLHSSKKLAPWSASPLFVEFPPPPRIVYRGLPTPSIVNVSFSIMDGKVCDTFKEAILKPDLRVKLVNVEVKVVDVAVNVYEFSDAASNTNPLPNRFAVRFLTPTAFRRSVFDCCPACPHYVKYRVKAKEGRAVKRPCDYAVPCKETNVPLPIPSLMFRNLARIWSTFSNVHLNVWGAARWAENAIVVAGFPKPGIRTVRIYEHPTTNKWIAGFIGTVRYAVKDYAYKEEYAKIAAALLKMAEITNVGVRRTAGLGMVKYIPQEEKQNNQH